MKLLIKSIVLAAMAQLGHARHLRSNSDVTTMTAPQFPARKAFMATKSTISNSTSPTLAFDSTATNLPYNGGPVMLGTVNLYFIWYGDWANSNPDAVFLLENLADNIGGSDYWNIQTTYFDSNGNNPSNSVLFQGSVAYPSFSSSLSGADIGAIVANTINSGTLPLDPNAVYFVFTTSDVDVDQGQFCNRYCGWHTFQTISGQDIKFAFVGDSNRCPSSCAPQQPGPNNNAGADGMASVFVHELEEAVTDPLLNAWTGPNGENGDTCAYTFGTTQGSSGQEYNINLGDINYLIQQDFIITNSNGDGYCGLSVQPSQDPCGNGNIGSGVCSDSSLCCSIYGWCGTGYDYCG